MNLWERLLEILEEQINVYQKLTDVMEAKQQIIIKNILTDLEEVVAQEGELAKRLNFLEKERLEIAANLEQELSLSQDNVTLDKLAEYLPEKYSNYYRKVATQLKDALEKANALNKTNQELLEASLAYVNYTLSLMTGMQASTSYGHQGQEQDSKTIKRSLFDHKV